VKNCGGLCLPAALDYFNCGADGNSYTRHNQLRREQTSTRASDGFAFHNQG
jgi:hypothetical protein